MRPLDMADHGIVMTDQQNRERALPEPVEEHGQKEIAEMVVQAAGGFIKHKQRRPVRR